MNIHPHLIEFAKELDPHLLRFEEHQIAKDPRVVRAMELVNTGLLPAQAYEEVVLDAAVYVFKRMNRYGHIL